ncbi:MAG TPA: toll/interleukin-1 receptor domain-containing protein [Stellaceae bacterium]|nr:toll/interleukin-1 receptor domain-containing protein [Stellaceae bacterium]
MARGDIFVSYCTKSDRDAAYDLVAHVESRGIECWIAPRDVQGGMEWAAEIVNAITVAKVMVLIFSASANASPQVRREVMLSVHRGVRVVPFRIEDIEPAASLEYFLGGNQWLDAFPPPLEPHYARLVVCLNTLLATPTNPPPRRDAPSPPAGPRSAQMYPRVVIEAANLRRLESDLAVYIGPFAQIAVHRAAAAAPSVDALLEALGGQIESETDRRKFLTGCRWLRPPG